VGIRLYARVRGDINPAFSIANMVARYEPTLNPFDGTMYVSFSMQNTGNISLSADAITKVSGIFGIPLGAEKTIKVPELLPGLGRDVTLKINGIGQWAIFTPTVKMKATISKNALDAGKLPIVTRDTTMVSAPFSWIVLIAFVLSVWLIIRFRINKRNRQMVQWLEYTEAEARRKAQEVAN
jgi:dihydroorotate dehydrogenase (fumarate)